MCNMYSSKAKGVGKKFTVLLWESKALSQKVESRTSLELTWPGNSNTLQFSFVTSEN